MSHVYTQKGARFSEDGLYRHVLWRHWDTPSGKWNDFALILGLNPSKADAEIDDPTIRKDVSFAKSWGCSGLLKMNLFGFCATEPEDCFVADDPVGPNNDEMLVRYAREARIVVAAWGNDGWRMGRDKAVRALLAPHCALTYLRLNKTGQPAHTLYLPGDLKPLPWV